MNSLLGPLLAYCAGGGVAVGATVALGAYLARRHNRRMDALAREERLTDRSAGR